MAGRPSKGDRGKFQLRLPDDLLRELKHYSFDAEEPLGDIVAQVVKEWWEAHPKRAKYRALVADVSTAQAPEKKVVKKKGT